MLLIQTIHTKTVDTWIKQEKTIKTEMLSFCVKYFQRQHLMLLRQSMLERVNGPVEHRAYKLL